MKIEIRTDSQTIAISERVGKSFLGIPITLETLEQLPEIFKESKETLQKTLGVTLSLHVNKYDFEKLKEKYGIIEDFDPDESGPSYRLVVYSPEPWDNQVPYLLESTEKAIRALLCLLGTWAAKKSEAFPRAS